MVGKLIMSVLVAGSLGAASVKVPSPSCISASTVSAQACQQGCCANKSCCATSSKRTSVPSQPLIKAGFELAAVVAKPTEVLLPIEAQAPRGPIILALSFGHTPPTPVLLCTFLI
jgi:hypothetical protein